MKMGTMKSTIKTLAVSRIRYNKSRTILTAVAMMLTTFLLMGVGTSAVGLFDMARQQASSENNVHASFSGLSAEQVNKLKNHMDVEALEVTEFFATVEYEKMNAFLNCGVQLKKGIYHQLGNLTEGHEAVSVDEICGPPAFFERMGVEPVIGNKIEISFRPHGEGMAETREFIICGLITQVDLSKMDVSDSRIAYSATVSEALAAEYLEPEEREYTANIRVSGEEELGYDEIQEKINKVAEDIGYDVEKVSFNKPYLYTMTDPGTEMIQIAGGIALLIVFFAGLVIYSIYYVSVITDIQEIGRLKALGASDRQVRKVLLAEGMRIAAFAVPVGLLSGYLVPRLAMPAVIRLVIGQSFRELGIGKLHMFSLPVLLLVVAAVLFVIRLSLRKPMRMAAKISPVEALRYQESSGKGKFRKGSKSVSLFRLSAANLLRNKKRTIVTIVTMGLSCVLFMSLAGVLSSMRAEDMARRTIRTGDFCLGLDYERNDKEYPERNLDSLQQQDYFSEEFLEELMALDGVQEIAYDEAVLIGSDHPVELFADSQRITLGWFDREGAEDYRRILEQGEIDYDTMTAENGAVYTANYFIEEYGLSIGDEIPLTIYDGNREIPLTVTIMASLDTGENQICVTKEVWDKLEMQSDSKTALYISVEQEKYDSIKSVLQQIAEEEDCFRLYSMDEEMEIGRQVIILVKYPMYLVLVMIAVISFMNLINTMITSIAVRKKELGILQAIGLSDKQLARMLAAEGLVYTTGTLLASVTIGNFFGYFLFEMAKENHLMSLSAYHYPLVETILLAAVLIFGQLGITLFIAGRVRKESLIDRIRSGE